jgi:hypothetical protein
MNPDSDRTPDATPFFIDFKDAKKYFFSKFFSYNLPPGTLYSAFKAKRGRKAQKSQKRML